MGRTKRTFVNCLIQGICVLWLSDLGTYAQATNSPGRCAVRGQCLHDGLPKPCVVDESPTALNDSTVAKLAKELCPFLFPEGVEPENVPLCCTADQVNSISTEIKQAEAAGMGRCRSCYHSFINIFCNFCYQNNAETTHVAEKSKNTEGQVHADVVDIAFSKTSAEGIFNSCKGVRFQEGTLVDQVMCKGMAPCNTTMWLDYLGSDEMHEGLSPTWTRYHLSDESEVEVSNGVKLKPFVTPFYKCSEPFGSAKVKCSCSDCEDVCSARPALPQLPPDPAKFTIGHYDGYLVVSLLIFVSLLVIVLGTYFLNTQDPKMLLERDESAAYGLNDDSSGSYQSGVDTSPLRGVAGTPQMEEMTFFGANKAANNNNDVTDVAIVFSPERLGKRFDRFLQDVFHWWGCYVAKRPGLSIISGFTVSFLLALGLFNFKVTTDPIDLWVSRSSLARQHMEFFNRHFGPFYRVEQLILRPRNQAFFEHNGETYGPALEHAFMKEALALQLMIENIVTPMPDNSKNVTLEDICLAPLAPFNKACAIQSVFAFYKSNMTALSSPSYLSTFDKCAQNVFQLQCFARYGGPIDDLNLVLGGFLNNHYRLASALVITIPVKNYENNTLNKPALEWEQKFIELVLNFNSSLMDIGFKGERSIQDELERGSHSDVVTVVISYMVMFVYIALALGDISASRLFLDSKISLGLVGVFIVLLSVASSLGCFSLAGVPATLIIIEVIPFLVLAVGVDNVFIMVQYYQRDARLPHETLEQQIGRVVGEVAPSMLLSSVSMSACFFIGALTDTPAVRIFALYAGVALIINFFLQMTCFIGMFVLDTRRQEHNRFDLLCCVKASKRLHRCLPPRIWKVKVYCTRFSKISTHLS